MKLKLISWPQSLYNIYSVHAHTVAVSSHASGYKLLMGGPIHKCTVERVYNGQPSFEFSGYNSEVAALKRCIHACITYGLFAT